MFYKVTQSTVLLTWDGDYGDILVNDVVKETQQFSPCLLTGLMSTTDYLVKIRNISGESNEISFTTLSEVPLRMNYKDETGELAKFILPE